MRSYKRFAGLLVLAAFAVSCQDTPEVTSPPTPLSLSVEAQGQCNIPDEGACEGAEVVESVGTDEVTVDAVVPFPLPTPAYTGSTALIDISGLTLFANYMSITDGTQTVSFSSAMNKRGPVPLGWLTWAAPPFTEIPNPHVLFTNYANSMTWTLSQPAHTFGFELEPNLFAGFNFTVDFYFGGNLVGSITRFVHGFAGARLYAAMRAPGDKPFDRVDISVVGNPWGFGVARVRYSLWVGVDIKPGSDPNTINPKSNGVVPVAILGSAGFDVTTIDVTTLTFGPAGATPAHDLTDPSTYADHLQDVNMDGYMDLVSHYRQKLTGLTAADTEACIGGSTTGGIPFEGCDAVRVLDK